MAFGAVVLLACPHFPNDDLFSEYFHSRSKEKAWCWGFTFVLTALVLVGYGFVASAYFHFLWMKPIRHLLFGLQEVIYSCMHQDGLCQIMPFSVICTGVLTLDDDCILPHCPICFSLLPLHDRCRFRRACRLLLAVSQRCERSDPVVRDVRSWCDCAHIGTPTHCHGCSA